jgi:DNA-binding NarL/FixJ family response regulator
MVGREASIDDGIRVLVLDGQDLFRNGLRLMLESEGLHVVGDACTAGEALLLTARLSPDVVLVDLDLPGSSSELVQDIVGLAPDARIIVLAADLDASEVIDALARGACGYLARNDSTETIVAGLVRAAAAGEPLLSARTTWALIDRLRRLGAERMRGDALRARLSSRELEVLALIAKGHDNREIAGLLFISPHTVKHHVRTICKKLEVENRLQAAVRAARAGLV